MKCLEINIKSKDETIVGWFDCLHMFPSKHFPIKLPSIFSNVNPIWTNSLSLPKENVEKLPWNVFFEDDKLDTLVKHFVSNNNKYTILATNIIIPNNLEPVQIKTNEKKMVVIWMGYGLKLDARMNNFSVLSALITQASRANKY